jgi:hypothetical protein
MNEAHRNARATGAAVRVIRCAGLSPCRPATAVRAREPSSSTAKGGFSMPLKLNVGLMKKIGQPRYGSLCASCHLEIEMESSLLESDADAFRDRIRRTFAVCRRAVETELAVGDLRRLDTRPATLEAAAGDAAGDAGGNRRLAEHAAKSGVLKSGAGRNDAADGDRDGPDSEQEFLPASASQIDYVRRLASRIGRAAGLRVEVLAQRCFGKPLAELSRRQATRLILTLRAVKAGELDWEAVMEDSAA